MDLKFSLYFRKFDKILFLWTSVFLINIITLFLVYFKIKLGGANMALDYNFLTGVTWYGEGKNIYFLPFIAFLITLANLVLYKSLKPVQSFLAMLCPAVSLGIQVIIFSAILLLTRVN